MQKIYESTENKEKVKSERAKKIEILKECMYLEDNIKELEEEYIELNSRLYAIKSIEFRDGSSSNNKENYITEKMLDRKKELQGFYKQYLTKCYAVRNKIQEALQELTSEKERNVLINKYFKSMTYYQISEKMNYSERQIVRIHNEAIDKLQLLK